MRIGVVTFHRAFNCGAMLQAWALKTVLERMGHRVEFPRCNCVGDIPRWRFSPVRNWLKMGAKPLLRELRYNLYSIGSEDASRKGFRSFRKRFLPERNCTPQGLADYYDVVIVGSDQVWTNRITGEWTPLFLGENAPGQLPYIAYSASAGDNSPNAEDLARIRQGLVRFCAITTRERALGQLLGCETACDPSLLLTSADYAEIEQEPVVRKPYVYAYTALPSPFLLDTVRAASERLAISPIITPIGQYSRFRAPAGLTYAVSPGRMVGYQRKAVAVVTDSFHGTAFALIHGKPFVSLQKTADTKTRIGDLLERLGLQERLVVPETSETVISELLTKPLPTAALKRLEDFSSQSRVWLRDALARANGGVPCS